MSYIPKQIYKYEVEKSKFIGLYYEINNIDEIKLIIEELKKEHKKARHVCYGYRFFENGIIKLKGFDDGEPKGTASLPIINALEKNKIINGSIFIVRYFGGIKLGTGGLYRSYSKTAQELLKLI